MEHLTQLLRAYPLAAGVHVSRVDRADEPVVLQILSPAGGPDSGAPFQPHCLTLPDRRIYRIDWTASLPDLEVAILRAAWTFAARECSRLYTSGGYTRAGFTQLRDFGVPPRHQGPRTSGDDTADALRSLAQTAARVGYWHWAFRATSRTSPRPASEFPGLSSWTPTRWLRIAQHFGRVWGPGYGIRVVYDLERRSARVTENNDLVDLPWDGLRAAG